MARHKKRIPADEMLIEEHAKHERVLGVPSVKELAARYKERIDEQMMLSTVPTSAAMKEERVFTLGNNVMWGKIRNQARLDIGGEFEIDEETTFRITKINGKEVHYDLVFDDGKSLRDGRISSGEVIDNKLNIFEFVVDDCTVEMRVYDKVNQIDLENDGKVKYLYFEYQEASN
jgi:hypothetical protein